ncbi:MULTISPECIES: TetR/AcrR family transcriptional regulator [Streptococcus]|jgi:hypothetical protein|uniref:Uncharacterized protein n=2 Tax=Streptococcus TaxID=1301 RepID=A0A3R9GJR5_STRSA|nr:MULTISPECIES: TetR/AcrR family transcriptional regulator [Streptococcus]MDQ8693678.1 TetR/AcrR family transcriptional regulator [Streptococcus sp. IsoGale022]RSI10457.1 hypothetical protein D8887_05620 [Streptococcus sanguinis]RSI21434.1 hypothetical protein D8886_00725 [Streptococcus sanguinis]RSI32404.1 hypothetical protein D8877_02070 [Streptococcus sanguinis]
MSLLFALEETREFFMEAFLKALREKPLNKISVKELCQRTGYNRSTFYYYFEDVYDLRKQVETNLIHSIISEISLQPNLTDEKFIKSLITVHKVYGEIIVFLNRDSSFYESYKQALQPHLLAFLKVEKLNTELDLIFDFVMGGIFALLEKYARQDIPLTVEELTLFIQEQINKLSVWHSYSNNENSH